MSTHIRTSWNLVTSITPAEQWLFALDEARGTSGMPQLVIASNVPITGAIPATEQYSDPIAVAPQRSVALQAMVLASSTFTLDISFVGSNVEDGNYVATGPGPLTLKVAGTKGSLDLGVSPWAFVRVLFSATSGSGIYRAVVNLYW